MYGDPDGHFPGVMEEITGAAAKIIFCSGSFLRPIGAKNHTGPFFRVAGVVSDVFTTHPFRMHGRMRKVMLPETMSGQIRFSAGRADVQFAAAAP